MPLYKRLKQYLFSGGRKEIEPGKAYDHWAGSYDSQPDNLMLALDEALTGELLDGLPLQSMVIADIGCGTGRHWQKLMEKMPALLQGFDVSAGMLSMLKQKYPKAKTFLLKDFHLPELRTNTCDLVSTTLTIAHIENIQEALEEWKRVLKPGGHIIITDYHPDALAKGAKRTFSQRGRVIAIRNHVHSIESLKTITRQLHLEPVRFIERKIDESVRHFYEKQNALHLFEQFYGVPIIFGIHLKKADAIAQFEHSG